MIQKLVKFLERRSQLTLIVYVVLLTVLLGFFDLLTGVEVHFLLLYLVPIFVASWFVSREVGIYLALFASLIWSAADSIGGRSYSSALIAYWNLLMRTAVFVLFAITQAQLRAKLDDLSKLASRDFLTGLPNGHAFYQSAAKEMDRAFGLVPGSRPFTLSSPLGADAIHDLPKTCAFGDTLTFRLTPGEIRIVDFDELSGPVAQVEA